MNGRRHSHTVETQNDRALRHLKTEPLHIKAHHHDVNIFADDVDDSK